MPPRVRVPKPVKIVKINTFINKILGKVSPSIRTKLNNVTGKCGTGAILTQKRTGRNSRVVIPYCVLMRNPQICSKEALNKFDAGVVVMLENNDYEDVSAKTDDLSVYLIQQIGSDDKVSCVVVICSTQGYSGSSAARACLERLKPIFEEKGWTPVKRKPTAVDESESSESDAGEEPEKSGTVGRNNIGRGNDKWQGHYYYDVSGGEQVTHRSHSGSGKEHQLFNMYHDYATTNACDEMKAHLVYLLLHCHDIGTQISEDDLSAFKARLREHLESVEYDTGKLIDNPLIKQNIRFSVEHGKDILYCPITVLPISVSWFEIQRKDDNRIELSHNEAVDKKRLYYDQKTQTILTAARATNLFWARNKGNMKQQDLTIDEYVTEQEAENSRRQALIAQQPL